MSDPRQYTPIHSPGPRDGEILFVAGHLVETGQIFPQLMINTFLSLGKFYFPILVSVWSYILLPAFYYLSPPFFAECYIFKSVIFSTFFPLFYLIGGGGVKVEIYTPGFLSLFPIFFSLAYIYIISIYLTLFFNYLELISRGA